MISACIMIHGSACFVKPEAAEAGIWRTGAEVQSCHCFYKNVSDSSQLSGILESMLEWVEPDETLTGQAC